MTRTMSVSDLLDTSDLEDFILHTLKRVSSVIVGDSSKEHLSFVWPYATCGLWRFLDKGNRCGGCQHCTSGVLVSQARLLPLVTAIRNVISSSALITLYWCTSTNHELVGPYGDAAALWGRPEAPSRHFARSLRMGGALRTM